MNVHNLMEEYVGDRVRDIYKQLEKSKAPWLTCSCESCIMDSISYVLNRSTPHYIVSGRGAVYTSQLLDNHQLRADTDALCMEAIRNISSVSRPYHKITSQLKQSDNEKECPSWNFPVISGSVLDGDTFEPIPNAIITLKDETGLIPMQDFSWANPSKTFDSTKGAFSFWPQSINAEKTDEAKKFKFSIQVQAENYQSETHYFEVTLTSEMKKKVFINHSFTMKISDIILFKK